MTDTLDFWPRLVLASLATWRLTHLLAREDGPFDLIARVRWWMGPGLWGQMLDCFQCLSLWVAAPLAWWAAVGVGDGVLLWLALSGAACLCERLTDGESPAPVLVQTGLDEKSQPPGDQHELLRTTP
jgi:hypothetical protein